MDQAGSILKEKGGFGMNTDEEIVRAGLTAMRNGIMVLILIGLAVLVVFALAKRFKSVRIVLIMIVLYAAALGILVSFQLEPTMMNVSAFALMGLFVFLTVVWIRHMLKQERQKQKEKEEAEAVQFKYGGRSIPRGKLPKDLENAQDIWEDM